VWVTEHHALPEYSHISASDVYMGYLARMTERIHLGLGNLQPQPPREPPRPQRRAGGDARSPHRWALRVRTGTGRGARTRSQPSISMIRVRRGRSGTRSRPRSSVSGSARTTRSRVSTSLSTGLTMCSPSLRSRTPRGVGGLRNPPTSRRRTARHRRPGFNFSPIYEMQPQIDAYKQASPMHRTVGSIQRQHHDHNAVVCMESPSTRVKIVKRKHRGYLFSLVCLYHDTFRSPRATHWPKHRTRFPTR